MRWPTRKPPRDPEHGDKRIVRRFLWKQLALGGETRWLEWAWIGQEYNMRKRTNNGWMDREWMNPQPAPQPPFPRPVPAKRPKPGGVNQKPEGPRPTPPPAPPRPYV